MDDTPTGAILQRDETTYAIVPRTPVGLVTPDIPLVKRTIEVYRDNAKQRERVARFIDRTGIEEVKEALC